MIPVAELKAKMRAQAEIIAVLVDRFVDELDEGDRYPALGGMQSMINKALDRRRPARLAAWRKHERERATT
jgi:hypothetical protein